MLQRVDDILQFIEDFTVNVDGVGHVCRSVSSGLLDYVNNFGLLYIVLSFVLLDKNVAGFDLRKFYFAASAHLISRTMATAIMALHITHLIPRGALKGKWRSHS